MWAKRSRSARVRRSISLACALRCESFVQVFLVGGVFSELTDQFSASDINVLHLKPNAILLNPEFCKAE